MNKHKRNGFAVVESLLVVLILAIVGFTGYSVWHKHKPQPVATAKTAAPSVSAQQYLTIKEWGVTMTVPPALNGLTYHYYMDTHPFATLDINGYKCGDLGSLIKIKKSIADNPPSDDIDAMRSNSQVKKGNVFVIGDSYIIHLGALTTNCGNNPSESKAGSINDLINSLKLE